MKQGVDVDVAGKGLESASARARVAKGYSTRSIELIGVVHECLRIDDDLSLNVQSMIVKTKRPRSSLSGPAAGVLPLPAVVFGLDHTGECR